MESASEVGMEMCPEQLLQSHCRVGFCEVMCHAYNHSLAG